MTNDKRFHQMGWIFAAALATVFFGSGFQAQTDKSGVVNVQRLISESDFGKTSQGSIDRVAAVRKEIITFLVENPVLTIDQAQRFRELMLKPNRTSEDDLRIAQIKADASANTKKLQELANKSSLTPEERAIATDFNNRAVQTRQQASDWGRDFQEELQAFGDNQYRQVLERVRVAIGESAKAQGYSTVFDDRYAPFGANDLTDAALTAMNAKK